MPAAKPYSAGLLGGAVDGRRFTFWFVVVLGVLALMIGVGAEVKPLGY